MNKSILDSETIHVNMSDIDFKVIKQKIDYKVFAREFANQGKLDNALSYCDNDIKCNKVDVSMHYLRAIILMELGNYIEAMKAINHVLYLDHNCIAHGIKSPSIRQALNKPLKDLLH